MKDNFPISNDLKFWPSVPSSLNGGINLCDKEYKLPENQTSKAKNMWFNQGELGIRWGQDIFNYLGSSPVLAAYKNLYKDKIIVHVGDKLIEIEEV